jgi:hypothetical protein
MGLGTRKHVDMELVLTLVQLALKNRRSCEPREPRVGAWDEVMSEMAAPLVFCMTRIAPRRIGARLTPRADSSYSPSWFDCYEDKTTSLVRTDLRRAMDIRKTRPRVDFVELNQILGRPAGAGK